MNLMKKLMRIKPKIPNCVLLSSIFSKSFVNMPTNEQCCLAWVNEEPCKSNRMKTDGFNLYSYNLLIGETNARGKVLHDYTAGGLGYVSQTTSQHVNLAKKLLYNLY